MTVYKILLNAYKNFPERKALIAGEEQYTYGELHQKVNQFAEALSSMGITKGDRVAVLLRNHAYAVIAYYAILKIGAVEVAFNVTTDSPKSISYKIRDCQPKAVVAGDSFKHLVAPALGETDFVQALFYHGEAFLGDLPSIKSLTFDDVFARFQGEEKECQISDGAVACIAYTSGTSGEPKGVMLSHQNLLSGALAMDKMEYETVDKSLSLVPLYHAYGKMILNSRFLHGSTLFLMDKLVFASEIVNLIEKQKITGLLAVPTILQMIMPLFTKDKDFSFFRYIGTGGARMSVDLVEKIWEQLPRVDIVSGYGLTEVGGKVSRIVLKKGETPETKFLSCGKVIQGHEMRIVDSQYNPVVDGAQGEITIKGPSVMQGYWQKAEATEQVIKHGWLHTGDLGFKDQDDDLFIVDRKKDIIKAGAELISPQEVESVLRKMESVKEAAIIGVKDPLMGEKIKAFVVVHDECRVTEEDIMRYCAKNLSPVKVPKIIEFRKTLPKASLGKVQKEILRKQEKDKIDA
jgi:long-chain acyl-CoA synthetase